MLLRAKKIQGFKLNAKDGEIGNVVEFYFDDKFWTVRYLVVNTGSWLTGRMVLVSPYLIKNVNYDSEHVDIDLTKQQIEESSN